MVVVEFFSEHLIENVISCLVAEPDLVLFVGDGKRIKKHLPNINRLLSLRDNYTTRLDYVNVPEHAISEIVDALDDIVQTYDDCHFDLSGGTELALVAAGIVYGRYPEKHIQLHQFNIRTGKIYDCDMDGTVLSCVPPRLTIPQQIALYGGALLEAAEEDQVPAWDFTEEFVRDVETMWEICRQDCVQWNVQTMILSQMDRFRDALQPPDGLRVDVPAFEDYLGRHGFTIDLGGIFPKLEQQGLLRYAMDGQDLVYSFKDPQIKSCLTVSGRVLELAVYLAARRSGAYDDVQTGVYLGWTRDTQCSTEAVPSTTNEIDGMFIRGIVPFFVSCKNGQVKTAELYKLNTVAERFGGKYAKKILITSTLNTTDEQQSAFLDRAKNIGIQVITNIESQDMSKLARTLGKLN